MENGFDLFDSGFPMLIFENWTPCTMRRDRIEDKMSEIDGNFSRTFLTDEKFIFQFPTENNDLERG